MANLIINDSIQMFLTGYPTVGDKYNVQGGVLESDSASVAFGSLVMRGGTAGYYKNVSGTFTAATISSIVGIVVATNVKLATDWPGTSSGVNVQPGEAFNLLLDGFIAVELASTADEDDILVNAPVQITSAGTLSTSSDSTALGQFGNATFTGMYEEQTGGVIVAEIYVK